MMTSRLVSLTRSPLSMLAGIGGAALIGWACSSCSTTKAQTVDSSGAGPEVNHGGLAPNAQIAISPVEEHVVGKAIVSSARIAFDENKVSHVFSPVTGRVTEILAQLGEHVTKGQPLAIIVSPDVGNAESDVNKAKANVTQTDKEFKRQQELFAAHAGAKRDLDNAQAANEQAVAELERTQQKLKLLLDQTASKQVSQRYTLIAPIDGEIVARNINPGAEVQGQYSGGATQELFTVGKLDDLWVMSDVYEQDIGRVKLGAPVQIETVAYPGHKIQGTVDWISGTLDPATRTAKVRCVIPNTDKDRPLKPEMYATVQIQTDGRKTLAIPRESILHFGDKAMVIAVDESKGNYERRPVVVDEDEMGEWVPVLHGLEPTEKIVTDGALLLSETVN